VAFDTNNDGILDENDAEFHKFRVWQDLDQDGESDAGELRTLSDAGIESFELWSDNVVREDGSNTIFGLGNYAKLDEYGDAQGSTGTFSDTAFAYSNFGFKEFEDGTKIIRGSDGDKTFVSSDDFDTTIELTDSDFEGYVSGAGDDSLSAGMHTDVLLSGEGGDDTITGGAGNDWLAGGEGTDVLSGGAGHDILFFDDLDTVDGGKGFDVGIVTPSVSVSMDICEHGLEAVYGNMGDDSFSAFGAKSVFMDGGEGSDTLSGSSEGDILSGGVGSDVIQGGAGNDWLFIDHEDDLSNISGGDGDDVLVIQDEIGLSVDACDIDVETIYGGLGDDTLFASCSQSVTFDGGAGDDVIHGNSQADVLLGGSGNDQISGGGGDDILDGWTGDDTLSGGGGDDVYIFGHGRGNDVINNSGGGRDAVWFAEDVSYEDVDFQQSDDNLVVRLTSTGETLTITNWFEGGGQLNTFLFSAYGFSNPAVTHLATDEDDRLMLIGDETQGIFAFGGDDDILGDDSNNYINGGTGDDTLSGGKGNDTLAGGSGHDVLSGGEGNDYASYSTSGGGVSIDLSKGKARGGDAEGDTLGGIENLIGSEHNDNLTGNRENNNLSGRGGNDRLTGNEGDDTLSGGKGNDKLDGGEGSDLLVGGSGDDTLEAGTGNDYLLGGTGDDVLNGDEGEDTLDLSSSNTGLDIDFETGTSDGSEGHDTFSDVEIVYGSSFNDTVSGSLGDGTFYAGWGDDYYTGGDGDDYVEGMAGADSLAGAEGNDTLIGGTGDDTIDGGMGDDSISGGKGADVLSGGDGVDTVSYEGSIHGVDINLAQGEGRKGYAEGDTLEDIEVVIGSDSDDTFVGDGEANFFNGGWGDDFFSGGDGADTFEGYLGNDTVSYEDSSEGVTIDLNAGTGSGGTAEGDSFNLIEGVVGSDYDDNITGSIVKDTLQGGSGDDTLRGGTGADILDGGDGIDTASYDAATHGVSVDLEQGVGLDGEAFGDQLTDIENLEGSAHADTLRGDGQDNVVDGAAGDDFLAGMAGDDTLNAGDGDDMLSSGYGDDTVSMGSGDDFAMTGDGDDLISMNNGDEIVVGGAGTDTAVFDGAAGDYVVETINGTTFVRHADGETNVLREVEVLRFDDREISVADTVVVQAGQQETKKKEDEEDMLARPRLTATEMISMAAALGVAAVATTKESSAYELGLLPSDGSGSNGEDQGIAMSAEDQGSNSDLIMAATGGDVDAGMVDYTPQGSSSGDPLQDTLTEEDDSDDENAPEAPIAAQTGNGEQFAPEVSGVISDEEAVVEAATEEAETTTYPTSSDDEEDDDETEELVAVKEITYSVELEASDVSGAEDSAIQVDIGAVLKFDVFEEALPVWITGLPVGASLSHGAEVEAGVWEVQAEDLGLLTVTPSSDDAIDFSLTVTINMAGEYDSSSQSDTTTFEVVVNAVADAPTLNVTEIIAAASSSSAAQNLTGTGNDDIINAGGGDDIVSGGAGNDIVYGDTTVEALATASLDISAVLTDLDGSESLTVTVFGVPVGCTLSAGTEAEPGIWVLTSDQLAGLEITVPAGDNDYSVDVVATSTDTDPDTGEQVSASNGPLSISITASDAIGDDVIDGGIGNDTLYGEAGDDKLTGGEGTDHLYGGSGLDTLVIDDLDVVDGGDDYDTAIVADAGGVDFDLGSANVEKVLGDTGDDRFYTSGAEGFEADGGAGDDVLVGGDGNDTLTGGSGLDAISAGAGNDSIIVDSVDDMAFIDGGEGADTLTVEGAGGVTVDLGSAHIETAVGGDGADIFLNTGSVAVSVDGKVGHDLICSGAGSDTLVGGIGNDTLAYSSSTSGVNVNLATGVVAGGFAAGDVISGFENVTGSINADELVGDAQANVLDGGSANDFLSGGDGDDTLIGGDGVDTAIYSGDKSEYSVVRRDAGVTVTANSSGEGIDTLESVEKVKFGYDEILLSDYALDGEVKTIRNTEIGGQLGVGDGVQFTISRDVQHGDLVINDDGTYTYIPDADYLGGDNFEYEMIDAEGVVNIGAIDVSVGSGVVDQSISAPSNNGRANQSSVTVLDDGGYVLSRVDFQWAVMKSLCAQYVRTQKYNENHEKVGDEYVAQAGGWAIENELVSVVSTGNGGFAVAYTTHNRAFLNVFNEHGEIVAEDIELASDFGRYQRMTDGTLTAIEGGQFVYTWGVSGSVFSQTFDSGFQNVGDKYEVQDRLSGNTYTVSVTALDDGNVAYFVRNIDGFVYKTYDVFGNEVVNRSVGFSNSYTTSYLSSAQLTDGNVLLIANSSSDVFNGNATTQAIIVNASGDTVNSITLGNTSVLAFDEVDITILNDGSIALTYLTTPTSQYSPDSYVRVDLYDNELSLIDRKEFAPHPYSAYGVVGGESTLWLAREAELEQLANGDLVVSWDSCGSRYSYTNIKKIVFGSDISGSSGNDAVMGNVTSDVLYGDTGADVIMGIGGDDTLYGDDGDDTLEGGIGSDSIVGGNGHDYVSYKSSGNGVSVDLATGDVLGGDATGDTIEGVEGVIGSQTDDALKGDDSNNSFEGLGGNDNINGGDGTDTVVFDGNYTDFNITSFGLNAVTVEWNGSSGDDLGTDTLINIEKIEFNDRTIYLDGTNNRPEALDDTASAVEDVALTIDAATLLANDSDFDGDDISLIAVGNASNGTVEIDGDGNVLFTPDAGYVGDAAFTYTVEDSNGESHEATVTVTVAASGAPIVLDLDGDGLEFTTLAESDVIMDVDGDGDIDHVAWIGADDGFLAFDRNGDGIVNGFSEISFVDDHSDARTDLDGLALAFDSNDDGIFDAADAKWASFGVWQDTNSDGVGQDGEFVSLETAGISSINLVSDWQSERIGDVWLHGQSSFAFEDGSQAVLGDVGLLYENQEVADQPMISFGEEQSAEGAWLDTQTMPNNVSYEAGELLDDDAGYTGAEVFTPSEDLLNANELADAMAAFNADTALLDFNIGHEEVAAGDVLWDEVNIEDMAVER